MSQSEDIANQRSSETDRNALNEFLYKEETTFMEEYHNELDVRLDKLGDALEERGSVVPPVTRFGLLSMLALLIGFGILALISWYSGPVG